jgi:hypothetical protein
MNLTNVFKGRVMGSESMMKDEDPQELNVVRKIKALEEGYVRGLTENHKMKMFGITENMKGFSMHSHKQNVQPAMDKLRSMGMFGNSTPVMTPQLMKKYNAQKNVQQLNPLDKLRNMKFSQFSGGQTTRNNMSNAFGQELQSWNTIGRKNVGVRKTVRNIEKDSVFNQEINSWKGNGNIKFKTLTGRSNTAIHGTVFNQELESWKTIGQRRRLKPFEDSDKDGVPNWLDCKPLNRKKQGFLDSDGNYVDDGSINGSQPTDINYEPVNNDMGDTPVVEPAMTTPPTEALPQPINNNFVDEIQRSPTFGVSTGNISGTNPVEWNQAMTNKINDNRNTNTNNNINKHINYANFSYEKINGIADNSNIKGYNTYQESAGGFDTYGKQTLPMVLGKGAEKVGNAILNVPKGFKQGVLAGENFVENKTEKISDAINKTRIGQAVSKRYDEYKTNVKDKQDILTKMKRDAYNTALAKKYEMNYAKLAQRQQMEALRDVGLNPATVKSGRGQVTYKKINGRFVKQESNIMGNTGSYGMSSGGGFRNAIGQTTGAFGMASRGMTVMGARNMSIGADAAINPVMRERVGNVGNVMSMMQVDRPRTPLYAKLAAWEGRPVSQEPYIEQPQPYMPVQQSTVEAPITQSGKILSPYSKREVTYTRGPYKKHIAYQPAPQMQQPY